MSVIQQVRCMYCRGDARVELDKGKKYLVCPKCGKKELTKMGEARVMGNGK